jgi:hypothetical protein
LNYSDDHLSPAASFSGDESGQIFDTPDIVRHSPTTNERVVDTQSGFLVVVKRVESRITISVKRRIGTPPASAIQLTLDESIKLSAILADQVSIQTGKQLSPKKIQSSVEDWLGKVTSEAEGKLDPFSGLVESTAPEAAPHAEMSPMQRAARNRRKRLEPNQGIKIAVAAGVLVVIGIFVVAVGQFGKKPAPAAAVPAVITAPSPLDDTVVDKFAREFVSDMLDFNPETYRISQIQAMSHMTGSTIDKYWAETNFPLPTKQLKGLPQGQTVMITKITQERTASEEKEVDIFAELVSANSKISNPVHLKLKLALTPDKQIKVGSMQDLTGKK